LQGLYEWAPQLIKQALASEHGDVISKNLRMLHGQKMLMVSDYSGMGGAEMAMHSVVSALASVIHITLETTFWRACDSDRSCQTVLSAEGAAGPKHVFPDLTSRVSDWTNTQMKRVISHSTAHIGMKRFNGMAERDAVKVVSAWARGALVDIMDKATFDDDKREYCYKCDDNRCRVYGPPGFRQGFLRLAVAGTTCTSWSSMGTRRMWASDTAVPFMVWLFEVRATLPHMVVHECTPEFDWVVFNVVLGAFYVISTIVFSPVQLGIPASRPRRYTLLVLRTSATLTLSLTTTTFAELFYRQCSVLGHVFWSAPSNLIAKYIDDLRTKLLLPEHRPDGSEWTMLQAMSSAKRGSVHRLQRLCSRMQLPLKYIVNLSQSAARFRSTEYVPALTTNTVALWSMPCQRLLIPAEYLSVQCIPIFDDNRELESRFAIERLTLNGKLSNKAVSRLAGNGMNLAAAGAVLFFGLSSSHFVLDEAQRGQ
jgi:hypothetical protein